MLAIRETENVYVKAVNNCSDCELTILNLFKYVYTCLKMYEVFHIPVVQRINC